jgi:hypothetical protein
MSAWSWLIVASSAYLVVSVLVALLLGAILHRLRDGSAKEPDELWASAPLAREELEEERATGAAPASFRVRVHRASH